MTTQVQVTVTEEPPPEADAKQPESESLSEATEEVTETVAEEVAERLEEAETASRLEELSNRLTSLTSENQQLRERLEELEAETIEETEEAEIEDPILIEPISLITPDGQDGTDPDSVSASDAPPAAKRKGFLKTLVFGSIL